MRGEHSDAKPAVWHSSAIGGHRTAIQKWKEFYASYQTFIARYVKVQRKTQKIIHPRRKLQNPRHLECAKVAPWNAPPLRPL